MTTASLWRETSGRRGFPRLAGDRDADVLVIGAGVSGLTAALLLQRAGRRALLVEARRIGAGETGNTTAHLTEIVDTRYHVLESRFGREGARGAAESSRAAIDRMEAFSRELGDACGFSRVPAYLYAEDDAQRRELEEELAALQRVGTDAALTDSLPLPISTRGAIRVERQAQLHPMRYLAGLAERLVDAGGELLEETRVLEVEDGEPCVVTTAGGVVRAREVLVLTNQPISSKVALHTKIAAYRTYAVAARPRGPWRPGLFWDMQDPYHYVRSQETSAGTFVIVGGEDHKTGHKRDTAGCFRSLERYAVDRLGLGPAEYRWSGQVVEPVDGLPFIGKSSGADHVYVATGFTGNGMTFGTVSAMVLSDLVLGRPSAWAELYDATRIKPLAQAREYVTENVDFPTHLVRDRLARGEVSGAEEIRPGEGRLLRHDGKMLAVSRDEAGTLHARSAICTHLGCHVQWNEGERTWDCPCHGSRFAVDGSVVNGPATKALAEAELEDSAERPPA
jgi:glycine/D-amino acid oxidase-like deaminating enzyme/nitrite reductase/ring-hydroxylating ferredoxin subunit